MLDSDLQRLRSLRRRAELLLSTLVQDLRPFRHSTEENGFVRKPDSDSESDDVNVTTTCSCVMALAQANKLGEMYPANAKEASGKIFITLTAAPWISSGLWENNAFTTTLVLRSFGFLVQAGMLPAADAATIARDWEPRLRFTDVLSFAKRLLEQKDPVSQFLFALFPRKLKKLVSDLVAGKADASYAEWMLARELERIIGTTVLYEGSRFPEAILSAEAKKLITSDPNGYSIARLNRLLLHSYYHDSIAKLQKLSLTDIAAAISNDPFDFRINDYPPAAAVIYWFVDGVTRAQISLPSKSWSALCDWATSEFNQKRSLVLAEHDAMMDPVAMGMAACLCARLRTVCDTANLGANNNHAELLPSRPELEHSIQELFKKQTNGIWPKYFPLFHYQDAGSNFCFTFELLEAVLCEFGHPESKLIDDGKFIAGLENAVDWCEDNRLNSFDGGRAYSGWNSGGYLETLEKGQPESWATAVVHMCLWELCHVLSARIQTELLTRYNARQLSPEKSTVSSLMSIEILEKGDRKLLNDILNQEIVNKYQNENEETLRNRSIKAARSALLFGPPGTSKTKVTEALAGDLRWPLIQIDPSHFLKNGLDGIYLQANEIFTDLMDLAGVVILFDEMDALVQTRDSALKLDTAAQFLTTYMLPKLTALHDQGRLIFLMATNFQERFDAAIKRTGRFDLLLCMGPPTLEAKLANLHKFIGQVESDKTKQAAQLINKLLETKQRTKVQLELYTFGEFNSFAKTLARREADILSSVEKLSPAEFEKLVEEDAKYVGLRIDDLESLSQLGVKDSGKWNSLADLDALDFNRKTFAEDESKITPIIRYLLDRRESKQQG